MERCPDPLTSRQQARVGNLLTRTIGGLSSKRLATQRLRGSSLDGAVEPSPYSVRDEDIEPRSGSLPKKAQQKRKTARRRGPKGSTYLEWDQVKQVIEFAHQARTEGTPLNTFVTIRAPQDVSDAEGKRIISRRIAHLGQALKRRGYDHIGVTVYEKGPHLHAHHLVHVPPESVELATRWNEGEGSDVHVRKADWFAAIYVTKQRRWMGPEIEDKIATRQGRRPWEKGAYIAGPRLTFTKAGKALIGHRTHMMAAPTQREATIIHFDQTRGTGRMAASHRHMKRQ